MIIGMMGMEKFKFTLLRLFDIAYRTRCSLPLLISTVFMVSSWNFSIDVELGGVDQDQHFQDVAEEEEEDE